MKSARVFERMADVLELKGQNPFRIRAYRRAAQNLETLTEDVETLAREDRLDEILGAGADLAGKIEEYLELDAVLRADTAELAAIRGVGPAIAESVAKFFAEPANREMCRRLTEAGVRTTHRTTPHRTGLAGKTFVLTGALHALTRDQAAERIGERGGRVGATVTPASDYVVVGADPGTKLARARALGVPTLDERAFLALLSE